MTTHVRFAAVLLAVFAAGCFEETSPADDATPPAHPRDEAAPPAMIMTKTCAGANCEANRTQCLAREQQQCNSCFATCEDMMMNGGTTSCVDVCASICSTTGCPLCDAASACDEHEYAFALAPNLPRDEPLFAACERWWTGDDACGDTSGWSDSCDVHARTEQPAAVHKYECEAAVTCDLDLDAYLDAYLACFALRPEEPTGGVEIARGLQARCGDVESWPAEEYNWFRPEIVAVAKTCLDEWSCHDIVACLEAWGAAVNP
ncbi:MAG TPA: hypothetical protein VGQ83_16730 [Polyangia bacterium]|jgi:hypothetical protein